jgi:hypothetical protein
MGSGQSAPAENPSETWIGPELPIGMIGNCASQGIRRDMPGGREEGARRREDGLKTEDNVGEAATASVRAGQQRHAADALWPPLMPGVRPHQTINLFAPVATRRSPAASRPTRSPLATVSAVVATSSATTLRKPSGNGITGNRCSMSSVPRSTHSPSSLIVCMPSASESCAPQDATAVTCDLPRPASRASTPST